MPDAQTIGARERAAVAAAFALPQLGAWVGRELLAVMDRLPAHEMLPGSGFYQDMPLALRIRGACTLCNAERAARGEPALHGRLFVNYASEQWGARNVERACGLWVDLMMVADKPTPGASLAGALAPTLATRAPESRITWTWEVAAECEKVRCLDVEVTKWPGELNR